MKWEIRGIFTPSQGSRKHNCNAGRRAPGKMYETLLKKKHLAPTAKINVSGNIYKQAIYREDNF